MMLLESEDNSLKSLADAPDTAAPDSQPEPLPRRFERFMLLSRVARGGMGEVYLAAAQGIEGAERPLIVKIVRPDHADDRSFVARFLDEARIQAQLSHPGVAQILEAATDAAGKPYVVVEHIEGRNLSDVRTRAGQLGVRVAWPEAIALAVCLAESLAHVHERTDAQGRPLEIVHRDLSPQNVMLGYGGEVKLIDFGTARGQNRRCQTVEGIVFAKPGYVAPEVANNGQGGVPADLYAFGVILWELLAGRRFLSGEAAQHMAAVGAGKRNLPPLARLIGAPMELDGILQRLTATRIEERFHSARAAIQELVRLLQRAPSLADGDRSVRGRISDLMHRLYPAEPARSRSEFARRLAEARSLEPPRLLPVASPEPPESSDPLQLAGTRYRLLREIGRGAMGVVHEAVHLDLGRTVALKLLELETLSPSAQSRFRAEARAIAGIDHENLVKIYDFGACQAGRLYYAMELLDGESLDRRLTRQGRLPGPQVIELGLQACRALEAVHSAGVVHRDLKPANLFLTRTGTLKVLDFGVAKSGSETELEQPSEALRLVGTPEYMAPEQARGQADVQSDIYALGTVLYELLTGCLPFSGEGPLAILAQKSGRHPIRPSTRLGTARCSAVLERVLLRALDPDPNRRQRDMSELRMELESALVPDVPRRMRSRWIGGLAVGATLVVCFSVLVSAGLRSPKLQSTLHHMREAAMLPMATLRERIERNSTAVSAPASPASREVFSSPVTRETLAGDGVSEPAHSSHARDSFGEDSESDDSVDEDGVNSDGVNEGVASGGDSAPVAVSAADSALAEVEALVRAGRDLRALDVLRRTAERHGDDPRVLGALAAALAKDRSWGEALRVGRRRVALEPSAEARLDLARLERATGHPARAVALLEGLIQEDETRGEARELLRVLRGNEPVALRD